MAHIAEDFKHGSGLKMGHNVIIEPDVIVGDNVKIGHMVTLKLGTRIGNDVLIDDYSTVTGGTWIGNNVKIRNACVIARAHIICDFVFIGPGVVTNLTKHVTHVRPDVPREQLMTYIGWGAVVGSHSSLVAGARIGPQAIIGAGSVVVGDIDGYGTYFGNPAKYRGPLPENYRIENEPENVERMYLTDEILGYLKSWG